MFGNIVSVSAVRLPWNERDVLLLTFRDAKVNYLIVQTEIALVMQVESW